MWELMHECHEFPFRIMLTSYSNNYVYYFIFENEIHLLSRMLLIDRHSFYDDVEAVFQTSIVETTAQVSELSTSDAEILYAPLSTTIVERDSDEGANMQTVRYINPVYARTGSHSLWSGEHDYAIADLMEDRRDLLRNNTESVSDADIILLQKRYTSQPSILDLHIEFTKLPLWV